MVQRGPVNKTGGAEQRSVTLNWGKADLQGTCPAGLDRTEFGGVKQQGQPLAEADRSSPLRPEEALHLSQACSAHRAVSCRGGAEEGCEVPECRQQQAGDKHHMRAAAAQHQPPTAG